MFARKIKVFCVEAGASRPCPVEWLDSYCMRSFTGRVAFDETLPVSEGVMEASFGVDLEALRVDMEDWCTRKFGRGTSVRLSLREP